MVIPFLFVYQRPNGRIYEGEWNNIFRHGQGSYWVSISSIANISGLMAGHTLVTGRMTKDTERGNTLGQMEITLKANSMRVVDGEKEFFTAPVGKNTNKSGVKANLKSLRKEQKMKKMNP